MLSCTWFHRHCLFTRSSPCGCTNSWRPLVVRWARRINLREHVRFAPDLAIEVLSPSTAGNDRGRKRGLLARYQIPEYWIVDIDRRRIEMSIFRESGYGAPEIVSGERLRSATIAGLEIDLVELFRDLG